MFIILDSGLNWCGAVWRLIDHRSHNVSHEFFFKETASLVAAFHLLTLVRCVELMNVFCFKKELMT
jgi:hypothetical protein